MPFGQFNETRVFNDKAIFDSTYVVGTTKIIPSAAQLFPIRFDTVLARNSDAVAHTLVCTSDGAGYQLPEVVVPPGAGFGGLPPVDVLTAWGLLAQQAFILLGVADLLQFGLLAVPTATKVVDIAVLGGSFPANY